MAKQNARIRKKHEKQKLQKKHQQPKQKKLSFRELQIIEKRQELEKRFPKSKDLSFEELLKKAEKADKAKIQRENRYKENLKIVAESGVNLTITKNMSRSQVLEAIKKEKRKESRKRTQEKKIALLMENGLSREEAEEFKNASFKDIYDIVNITYTIDKWVAVAWWDRTGDTDMRIALAEIQRMSTDQKIDLIHDFYLESLTDEDSSNSMQGVAVFIHGNSKEHAKQQLEAYRKRNYPLSVPFNYVNIGISNEFSVEGVVDMMYLAMAKTSNLERKKFYEAVRYFCKNNLPEIYKRVF